MEDRLPDQKKGRSFSFYLLFSMVILILCTVGFLTINHYLYAKDMFDRELHLLQNQTEGNVREALLFKDTTANLFDSMLNNELEKDLLVLVKEYSLSGNNPDRMNLSRIRAGLGTDFDIYVINESGVITHTTYAP